MMDERSLYRVGYTDGGHYRWTFVEALGDEIARTRVLDHRNASLPWPGGHDFSVFESICVGSVSILLDHTSSAKCRPLLVVSPVHRDAVFLVEAPNFKAACSTVYDTFGGRLRLSRDSEFAGPLHSPVFATLLLESTKVLMEER